MAGKKSNSDKNMQRQRARQNETLSSFEELYGKNVEKLEAWQLLCADVGVAVGTSIKQCKTNMRQAYVNIIDFVKAKKTDKPVHRFNSLQALRGYTQSSRKYFALEKAKESPLLRALLVSMSGPGR